MNEEAVKHAYPQCITHTTSVWQRVVSFYTHATYTLEKNVFLKHFSDNSYISFFSFHYHFLKNMA